MTDIYPATRGKKQAFTGERIYEKNLTGNRFNTGIRYRQLLTENRWLKIADRKQICGHFFGRDTNAVDLYRRLHGIQRQNKGFQLFLRAVRRLFPVQPGRKRIPEPFIPAPHPTHLPSFRQCLYSLPRTNFQGNPRIIWLEWCGTVDWFFTDTPWEPGIENADHL